jgi:hypothetical protein
MPPFVQKIGDEGRDGIGTAARRNLEKRGAQACRDAGAPFALLEFSDGRLGRASSSDGRRAS